MSATGARAAQIPPEPVEDRFETARTVADAILYEGYVLYPYRASSRKNQVRFQWGVLTADTDRPMMRRLWWGCARGRPETGTTRGCHPTWMLFPRTLRCGRYRCMSIGLPINARPCRWTSRRAALCQPLGSRRSCAS